MPSEDEIEGMISREGEKIEFTRKLRPSGNVEDWLKKVQQEMRDTLLTIAPTISVPIAIMNLAQSRNLYPTFLPFISMQKVIVESIRAPVKNMKGSNKCHMVRGVSSSRIFGLVQKDSYP